jgi:hypothetical protein
MKGSGYPLAELLEVMDHSPAAEKVLVLDTCHPGEGVDIRMEPSSEEQLSAAIKSTEEPLQTKHSVIVSCRAGQRGQVDGQGRGLLAAGLTEAFAGKGDVDQDGQVSTSELFQVVNDSVRSASAGAQSPALLNPQKIIPPRLSKEAREAIERLATVVLEAQPKPAEAKKFYDAAKAAASGQPEPQLLYGLALLKARKYDDAVRELRENWKQFPRQLLAVEGMVWALFERRDYINGVKGLTVVVTTLPEDSDTAARVAEWVGRLRAFAAAEDPRIPPTELEKIDQAVERTSEPVRAAYQAGRNHTASVIADFQRQMDAAVDEADRLKISNIERRRLGKYASFPFEAAVERVRGGMKK